MNRHLVPWLVMVAWLATVAGLVVLVLVRVALHYLGAF